MTDELPRQYLAALTRFQEAQRIGARKEKESLDRARAVSFRQQGYHESPFADNFVSSPYQQDPLQQQQQAVLPMEQEVDLRALRERDEQLRELEVSDDASRRSSGKVFFSLDEHRRSERIVQRRGETRPRSRLDHR